MSISFEIENGTVLCPVTTPILVAPNKARSFIKKNKHANRSHIFPLIDAAANFACSLLMAVQGCDPFDLPRSPWIINLGDDLHFAWGPESFDEKSINRVIAAAESCVLVTSGPDPLPYRVAATCAVRDRKNVVLIESLPHQHDAWINRIESVREGKDLPTFVSIPNPGTQK